MQRTPGLRLCPLRQQGTLFLVARQRRSPVQRCPGLVLAAEFLQQVSMHGM